MTRCSGNHLLDIYTRAILCNETSFRTRELFIHLDFYLINKLRNRAKVTDILLLFFGSLNLFSHK